MSIQKNSLIPQKSMHSAHVTNGDSPASNKVAATEVPRPLTTGKTLLILGAHVLLGLMFTRLSGLATAHALATIAIGVCWIAVKTRREAAAYVAFYILGSEVLWRMSEANVIWEYGKYATCLVLAVGLLKGRRPRPPIAILLYFALLLPSVLFTIQEAHPFELRTLLSFNLSGPLALMIAALFFTNATLFSTEMHKLFVAAIAPITSIAVVTMISGVGSGEVTFSQSSSNYLASGGFGPNQVSAVLGIGALLAFLCVIDSHTTRFQKKLMILLTCIFVSQAALTFSRGGVYLAACAALVACLYFLRERKSRLRLIVAAAFVILAVTNIIFPVLEQFTHGSLSARFRKLDTTGRDQIAAADLEIWKKNPLLGVGPGMAKYYRANYYRNVAAHTEFTRLLAEHGVLGLVAMILMLWTAWRNFRSVEEPVNLAIVVSLLVWSMAYMLINAMRLVAPSFLFAMSCATFVQVVVRKVPAQKAPRTTTPDPGKVIAASFS